MQDLMLPAKTQTLEANFGPYRVIEQAITLPGYGVVLMKKTDENGKHYYLVAERESIDNWWVLKNGKEFGHAINRAYRYFEKRRVGLGGE